MSASVSTSASVSVQPPASALEDVRRLLGDDLAAVDQMIIDQLKSDVLLVNQIGYYIVGSGGKRMRPLLSLLSANALGYSGQKHIQLATIVEFIHTATLLHDDVVDDSNLRRGRPTANAVFGNEASVLVGDFLYSRAFQLMVSVGDMRIMDIMADTTNVIAEGEVMQLINCNDPDTTEERYLEVIRSKTAKLFEAAARVGAVLSQAPTDIEDAIAAFGTHIGTAFQLVDDVLDYQGDPDAIGKSIGDDLAEGKPTLPLIHAMREGNADQAQVIREAIEQGGRDRLEDVLDAVESTGAIAYTARAAADEAKRALKALERLPPSPYKDAMESMASFSVKRAMIDSFCVKFR